MNRPQDNQWNVSVDREAVSNLQRLPEDERIRILRALDKLSGGPFQPGSRRLHGRPEWRFRVGARRALFLVDFDSKTILVTDIGSRGDVYKHD